MARTETKMTIKEQIAFLEAIDEALEWCDRNEKSYMEYDGETETYSEPKDEWSERKLKGLRKLHQLLENYAL